MAELSQYDLKGLTILVVEDDADARELVEWWLRACGATVHAADSALAALALLDRQTPDVMVSDIAMPEHDGYELVRVVRSLRDPGKRRVPAIAVTAHSSERDRARAFDAGFNLHLAKPVPPERLVEAVSQLARSAQHLN